MFIWDFVASKVLDDILEWVFAQLIGFLGDFFATMGNMGVELFELAWVQALVEFFTNLGWALFATSLVVCCFDSCALKPRSV